MIRAILLSLLFINALWAQETIEISSLKQAQDFALENNVQVKNAQYDEEIAKKKTWETTTIGLPQINGEASYNNQLDVPTQVIPANAFDPMAPADLFIPVQFGIEQSMSAGITISQLLFDGSYFVGLQAAKEYAELSRKQSDRTKIDVRYAVTKAYYTVLSARKNQKIMQGTLENMRKTYSEVKATYEQGFIESIEKDRMELTLNLLEDQYIQVKRQIQIAEALLKFQIGFNLSDSIVIADSIQNYLPKLLSEEAATKKIDYASNIEYQALEQGLRLQELDMKRYKMQQYPSLAGFFTHSQNAFSNDFDFFESDKPYYPTTIWGLKLNVPILNSLGQRAKIMQSKYEVEKIMNQQKQLETKIDFDYLNSRLEFKSAKERFGTQEKNLKLAKKIYDTTIIKHKEGVGSSLEVSDAQTKFLETQSTYTNALYQLLITKTDLDKAVGNYDF